MVPQLMIIVEGNIEVRNREQVADYFANRGYGFFDLSW